jgi:serine/threonine-protein kinase HipA
MHTLSGLLQASPSNYSVTYEHLAQVANNLTRDIKQIEQVFKLATFNILAVNRDDHSKNVAFLMDSNGSWKVAPAYDLTFFEGQFNQHKMSLNKKGKPEISDLITFSKNFGLNNKKSLEIIERVKEELSHFKKLAKEYDVSKFELNRIQKAIENQISLK